MRVFYTKRTFGPGAFVEFYCEAIDTMYTDTNVYRLVLDPALAVRIGEVSTGVLPIRSSHLTSTRNH